MRLTDQVFHMTEEGERGDDGADEEEQRRPSFEGQAVFKGSTSAETPEL
jgi:hypothetical protein